MRAIKDQEVSTCKLCVNLVYNYRHCILHPLNEVMMIQMVLVLSVLGSHAVVMSDEVNLTATIPPGYALQDYLCSGPLKSNTTVVLDDGEHRISSGPPCDISSEGNITITGFSMKSTTVHCEGEGRVFRFSLLQMLTAERMTFINCGIQLVSIENTFITNCTFQNSSNGAIWSSICSNIYITGCVFQNNSATYGNSFDGGGAVRLGGLIGDVGITDCVFQNNHAIKGALLNGVDDSVGGGAVWMGNDSFTGCEFQENITFDCMWSNLSTGYVNITNCTFQNNNATDGGAVMLGRSQGNVKITNCTFQNNSATNFGGAVRLDGLTGNAITITNCTFQNNTAFGCGAMQYYSIVNGGITNCIFLENSASYLGGYGGAVCVSSYLLKGYVSITNCTFHKNIAAHGGGISIVSDSLIQIYNSTFSNNTAVDGAAFYAKNELFFMLFTLEGVPLGYLLLQDVVVKDNHGSSGGAIFFDGVRVDIFGNTPTGSQFSSNSAQGAIQGQNGLLLLHGNITFAENRGVNGGAISLSSNVPLYFYEGCRVEFSRNVATRIGGAIYHYGDQNNKNGSLVGRVMYKCIVRFTVSYLKDISQPNSFSITFTDNHAQQGGHAVYATPIYNCLYCFVEKPSFFLCTTGSNLTSFFTITPLPEDVNDTQVLSSPAHVHLCGCSDPKLCNVTSQYQGKVTTYPGGTVRLNVTSVDDGNNLSPSVVYTQIDTSDITSQNIALGPRQEAQWIGTVCGTIEYQIYGPEMASFKLLLSNYADNSPAVIEVELLPCEPGFTLSSTGVIKCDCSLFFTSLGVVCDTSDGTVIRNKITWIGVYNNTLPALASICPLDYCNSAINKLSLGRPGDLCSGGRTGILCGHCQGNHSVIFGSSKCQECTDMWLITLVMFAVLGVLLVATLFFLNLTVTQGTLYGLIFYANIIQVNTSIFFSQSILNPMKVIVSFVNLDLGLPLCFYDGMDDADKAGLQFVFPAYLLILTMTVIVFCHYCLQRSPNSNKSCWYRFPIIIGERAVGVLSTLIYLSYSKLLRTFIDIFTYSTVHLPTGDMYVWFYDGNVEYLHGKHSILFVVAMVTCTLFLLPYTISLTFIPIIERYSEYNKLFNYLHKKANRMKPMNDAHYAPYKGGWRWWLGARLWLLVVMYSLNPVYSSDKPSLLLSIQATVVILFTIAQARIEPFGQSHQQTDRCTRYTIFCNGLYNCLDLFYLINYIALALSMSYILEQSSDQAQMTVVSVGVLVGLYVVVLMVTVLYHLIVVILKACKMYDRARKKINGLFERKYELMVPIELDDPTTNTVSTTPVTVNYGLREPLCED